MQLEQSINNDPSNYHHTNYNEDVVAAVIASRVTRKGRRVARDKMTIDRSGTPTSFQRPTLPGAFAHSSLADSLNVARFSSELDSARTRMEEMRTRRSPPHEVPVEAATLVPVVMEEETGAGHRESNGVVDHINDTEVTESEPEKMNDNKSRRHRILLLWILAIALLTGAVVLPLVLAKGGSKGEPTVGEDTDWPTPTPQTSIPLEQETQTLTPTSTPLTLTQSFVGDRSNGRIGQSISLSGDGKGLAYTIPGNNSVAVLDLATSRVEVVTTDGLMPPKLVQISEDGKFLAIAGSHHVVTYEFHVGRWEQRGLKLYTSSLFSESNVITSMFMEADDTVLFVALALVDQTDRTGLVAVFEQISHSWTPRGDILPFEAPQHHLEVTLSRTALFVVVGSVPSGKDTGNQGFVKVYGYIDTIDSYDAMQNFPISRRLYALHMISTSTEAVISYLDGEYVRLFTANDLSHSWKVAHFKDIQLYPEVWVSPALNLKVSRDRTVVAIGRFDVFGSPLADYYQYDQKKEDYDFSSFIGIDQSLSRQEETKPSSISVSLSRTGNTVAIGLPDAEARSFGTKSGVILLYEQL